MAHHKAMDLGPRLASDARVNRAAGLVFAAGGVAALAAIDPSAVIKRIMCPFQLLTGLPCPLCGMTRAMHHLFSGDLAHAWLLNPLSFAVGGIIALLIVRSAAETLTGHRARPLPRLTRPWVAVAVAIVLMHWAIRVHQTMSLPHPPQAQSINFHDFDRKPGCRPDPMPIPRSSVVHTR